VTLWKTVDWKPGYPALAAPQRHPNQVKKISLRQEGMTLQITEILISLSKGNFPFPFSSPSLHRLHRESQLTPSDSLLDCILTYWKCFDPANLKKERLTNSCNEVWSQYQLGTKKWYKERSLDYDTILQLDKLHKR
jgi:hypothetical protein